MQRYRLDPQKPRKLTGGSRGSLPRRSTIPIFRRWRRVLHEGNDGLAP